MGISNCFHQRFCLRTPCPLAGDKKVLKAAQDFMIQRLSRLDADTVKSDLPHSSLPDDGPETDSTASPAAEPPIRPRPP